MYKPNIEEGFIKTVGIYLGLEGFEFLYFWSIGKKTVYEIGIFFYKIPFLFLVASTVVGLTVCACQFFNGPSWKQIDVKMRVNMLTCLFLNHW